LKKASSKIWNEISTALEGKMTSVTLHLAVHHNRNNWQTNLKNLLGINEKITVLSSNDKESSTDESFISSSESSLLLNDSSRELFKFSLSYEKFRLICPTTTSYKRKNKRRNYEILTPYVWTDIINDEFLKAHKLPCNFIYKRGKAYTNSESRYYITFKAKCKDCDANLFGWSESKPDEGKPLDVSILTNNTKGLEYRHNTKRPLKGIKRQEIGQSLKTDLACNWRRANVDDMEFGSISPPNLYKTSVLRKAKQESKDKEIGKKYKCSVQSLVEFKNNSKYSGSIHTIGIDPFLVHYWTQHQIIIYKEACKNYCKLSIDATGSLVKKLKRSSLKLLSSHIFLYEAVVSTSFGNNMTVSQMLSEKQNTLTIFLWLSEWMQFAIGNPNEVVCDFSKALLGATSRAFCNGSSISSYVENCFMALMGHEERLPCCFLRIDVAHVIKIFCRLKCLTGVRNKTLKEFYVRSLRLLLSSENLFEFGYYLEAVLTVIMSETDGWIEDDNHNKTPAEKNRENILNKIKGLPEQNDFMDGLQSSDDDYVIEDNNIEVLSSNRVQQYLNSIYEQSKTNSLVKGDRLSAYYLPELANHVLRICKDFPLWTNVMRTMFKSPYVNGSSAVVENDFKELKSQILRFDVRPMSADRFIITHLKSIESNAKLIRSTQIRDSLISQDHRNNHISITDDTIVHEKSKNKLVCAPIKNLKNIYDSDSDLNTSPIPINNDNIQNYSISSPNSPATDDELSTSINSECSLSAVENWRGFGNDTTISPVQINKHKKQRVTKYMSSNPEIERILSNPSTRSSLDTLLLNGNISTPIRYNKNKYLLHNTCPFDSVSSILVMAYIDISFYKDFINTSKNRMLQFCKELAHHKTSKKTYTDRFVLLKDIFNEDMNVSNIKLINTECNVSFIVTQLLKDAPSAEEHVTCSNNQCKNASKTHGCPTIIMRFRGNGFNLLQQSLIQYIENNRYECQEEFCSGILNSFRILGYHLFIETDIIAENQQFKLDDFPVNINIDTTKLV